MSPRITRSSSHIVIPARLEATRLPRKMLLNDTGKSLIQHTYEAASRARRPNGLCVATDHEEIAAEVRRFGGNVVVTARGLHSGTDRVAVVAEQLADVDIVVNVQGDEPEIAGSAIDLTISILENDAGAVMSTLAAPLRDRQAWQDSNCVKVVVDDSNRALYFSRSPIPYFDSHDDVVLATNPPLVFQHIGLYAYRRDFLLKLAQMPPAALERLERLEQLRVLSAGFAIVVGIIDEPTLGINTPEDYRRFVDQVQSRS